MRPRKSLEIKTQIVRFTDRTEEEVHASSFAKATEDSELRSPRGGERGFRRKRTERTQRSRNGVNRVNENVM